MVGLSQIRQLEIQRESFCQSSRIPGRDVFDDGPCLESGTIGSAGDGKLAQGLHVFKERASFLFLDHISQESSERSNISTQRRFFEFRFGSEKFLKAFTLVRDAPEWLIIRHGFR